jgi:hypothetical protein
MAVLLLCACDNATERPGEERVALRIFSSIKQPTVVTRAAESHWDDHDQIGLFATTYNTQTVFVDDAGTTCSNLLYTFDDGDNYETYGRDYRLFSGKEIFMPNAPNAIDIYAYYPYKAGTVPTGIDIDLTDQTKIVDLMTARKTYLNKSNSDTKLLFEHKLVKVRFNLKAGDELLSNEISQAYDNDHLSVKINKQYHKANYNLFTDAMAVNTEGIIEAIEDPATTEGYEKSYQMTVLPYSGSEVRTVSIRVGTTDHPDNTFTFTIDENFVSGVKYVYSVIVDATSIRVKENEFAEQW